MKTNQLIKREMGDFNVFQRTDNGMFDATALMRQWNEKHDSTKSIAQFLNQKGTKEYIESIIEMRKTDFAKKQNCNNQEVTLYKTIKGRAIKSGGRTPDTVFMDPLLFIEFAGYFSPRFRAMINQFALDHLIEYRNKLGDQWAEFTSSCQKIGCTTPEDYKLLARCLNCAVLGKERQHEQRNVLSEEEVKELYNLASIFVSAVKHRLIRNISDAKKFFQEEYTERFLSNLPFAESVVIN